MYFLKTTPAPQANQELQGCFKNIHMNFYYFLGLFTVEKKKSHL